MIFQIINFAILYLEKDRIEEHWKTLPLKTKIGRVFMLHLPIFVIISLYFKPIS